MNTLLCIILLLGLISLFDKQIKKYSVILYVLSVLISCICIFLPKKFDLIFLDYIINDILRRGSLATALFIIVMYAVVFPFNKDLKAKLMKLRGELAILASLITLIHNIHFGKKYFVLLFTDVSHLKAYEISAAVISLLMIILLFPLTFTSFVSIRKKMNPKSWKALQRWSYLFYALLYVHIVLIFSRNLLLGKPGYIFNFIVYTLIFGIYLILRLRKYIIKTKEEASIKKADTLRLCLCMLIALVCVLSCVPYFTVYSEAKAVKGNTVQNMTEAESSSDGENTSEALDASDASETENSSGFTDGVYEAKAAGYNGNVFVSVTVEGGKITDIKVTKHSEDDEYYYDTVDKVIPDILEKQSTDVDIVSGATSTSEAIIKAVNKALEINK